MTFDQFFFLYSQASEMQMNELRFQAAIRGVDLDKAIEGKEQESKEDKDFIKFGDPKDYEKMSMKERRELTEKMKAQMRGKLGGFMK